MSQLVLGFGTPFALIPLIRLSTSAAVTGTLTLRPAPAGAAWGSAALAILLNLVMVSLTFTTGG